MYRRGLSTPKIAELCNVELTTVNWTIGRRSRSDPLLKAEHQRNAPTKPPEITLSPQWLARLQEFAEFMEGHDVPPRSTQTNPAERRLARWVRAQRKAAALGSLGAEKTAALDEVGSWRAPMRSIQQDKVWSQRLDALAEFVAMRARLPNFKKPEDDTERKLGIWLHMQRQKQINGWLPANRRRLLDKHVSTWNTWRPRLR
ncbi:helicase associated domain-containing protein [Arthrobacter sp. MI7-26]|uniref:helicase associated domain-containing protein n=1 Tax=Arthrobacter sp. MI7-26 TaxID=2993653 RepID=UPI003A598C40